MKITDHIKLFLADTLLQLFGYKHDQLVYGLLGLDSRQRHILRERRKMSTKLWYDVLNYYKWRCGKCGVFNYRNKQAGFVKMEVDHAVSLYNFGKTQWSNLQVLCSSCNRAKSTKNADYR